VAAKLTPLILFVLLGLALALPHPVTPAMITVIEPNAWLDAVLLLVFAYGGFEAALVPLGEARDPRRDAPFALFLVLAICAVLYTLVQVVVIATLPDPAAAARPLAASARVIAGSAGAITMAVAAVISVYGYIAGAMVNVPRLTFAMAEGGDLPSPFARIHPRFRTPHLSVVTYAVLVWGLAASGSFLQNLSLSAVSRLVTYGMVCAALPVLRGRDRGAGSAALPLARFRLPGGVLWAVLGIAFSLTLSTRMTQQEFLVLSATGLLGLLNWLWVRRTSR